MLALRVPCDARMSRRDAELAIAQTDASRTLRPILCFSASLNGTRHSGMPLAGIHSLPFLDIGLRRYDERFSLHVSTTTIAAIDQILTVIPFVLSSTAGLERNSARTV